MSSVRLNLEAARQTDRLCRQRSAEKQEELTQMDASQSANQDTSAESASAAPATTSQQQPLPTIPESQSIVVATVDDGAKEQIVSPSNLVTRLRDNLDNPAICAKVVAQIAPSRDAAALHRFRDMYADEGLSTIVLNMFKRHEGVVKIQEFVMWTIQALPSGFRGQVPDNEVCSTVMSCLRRHENNPGVVKQGLSAIANVISEYGIHGIMHRKFVDAGACDVVMSCLSQHMDHAGVIESGLATLHLLTADAVAVEKFMSPTMGDNETRLSGLLFSLYQQDGIDKECVQDMLIKFSVCAVKSNEYKIAIEIFSQLASFHPDDIKWQLMVASCWRRMGNYHTSMEVYKQTIAQFPGNLEALRYLWAMSKDLGTGHHHEYELQMVSKLLKTYLSTLTFL